VIKASVDNFVLDFVNMFYVLYYWVVRLQCDVKNILAARIDMGRTRGALYKLNGSQHNNPFNLITK